MSRPEDLFQISQKSPKFCGAEGPVKLNNEHVVLCKEELNLMLKVIGLLAKVQWV